MTHPPHSLIVAGLLLMPGAAAAQANEHPAAADSDVAMQLARPGPDFPNLESFYPVQARRARQEGIVIVAFCADPTGKLTAPPTLGETSGNDSLDAAALELAAAGSGHYLPATRDGIAISGCARFKVAFKLRLPPTAPGLGPDFPNSEAYYPLEARMAGQEGVAIVRVCIDPAGALSGTPTVVQSSGNALLDAGAVKLASAGSGHYLPATDNGAPVPGCARLPVAFKLDDVPDLQLDDPRFPTIDARIAKLSEQYGRRMEAAMGKFRPNTKPLLTATYPDPASVIRQYARNAESALDEGAAATADFLEDMDYLQKSADIPAKERSVFASVWPQARAQFTASVNELLTASRDLVRLTDELADYVGLKYPERVQGGAGTAAILTSQDPEVAAIQAKARLVMQRLRTAVQAVSGSTQP